MKKATAHDFYLALGYAVSLLKDDKLQIDTHSTQHFQVILDNGGVLFLSENRDCGIAVNDGYICSLFKNPNCPTKNVAKELLELARANGGYFLEAYGNHLEDLYIKNDFQPVARLKFNEEFAPIGWESTNLISKPDVVFFVYVPNAIYTDKGLYFDDYANAYNYAKNY